MQLPLRERRQVTEEFNDTRLDVPDGIFVTHFERHAALDPNAIAIVFEGAALSYSQLNRRANSLAHQLRDLGVTRGVRVALCVERSLELLAALLAVQKAGGAYVPLDPGFPNDRLNFMLNDSGAAVLVADRDVSSRLQLPAGLAVLVLTAAAAAGGDPEENPATTAGSGDPAYVIYTSGSTGCPKGVVVSHGSLLNFLWAMRQSPGLASTDALAAVTTISFDIAGLELYLPLLVGARIELISRELAIDGAALAACLHQSGATVMQATPSTWRLLIEADWRPERGVRALCGGESLPPDLAGALLERVSELWNLFGPTETTIWSTVERVNGSTRRSRSDDRLAIHRCTSWATHGSPCRSECRERSGLAVRGWLLATTIARSSAASALWRIRLPHLRERGCTEPATSDAGSRMGASSTWESSTIR